MSDSMQRPGLTEEQFDALWRAVATSEIPLNFVILAMISAMKCRELHAVAEGAMILAICAFADDEQALDRFAKTVEDLKRRAADSDRGDA